MRTYLANRTEISQADFSELRLRSPARVNQNRQINPQTLATDEPTTLKLGHCIALRSHDEVRLDCRRNE